MNSVTHGRAARRPRGHNEHRQLLVIGLPHRVSVLPLIAQVQTMRPATGLAAARRRPLGCRQIPRKRCLERFATAATPSPGAWASRHTAATLPLRRR